MVKVVLAAVILVLCIGAGIILAKLRKRILKKDPERVGQAEQENANLYSLVSKILFAIGIVVPGVIMAWSSFRIVDPGYAGVVVIMGDTNPTPLHAGLSLTNPFAEIHPMSVQIKKHEGMYSGSTSDVQEVNIQMILNVSLIEAQAPKIYSTIGIDYVNTIIVTAAPEVVKAEVALYKASDIVKLRPKIKANVQATLKIWLAKYGLTLHEVSLADIDFSPEYNQAIETKQLEEQKAQQKEYELIQGVKDAEIREAKAKGEADAAIEQARGEAESLRMRAEAQADYNQKVAASLTPALIQKEYIAKWDGILPKMITGESGLLLQMSASDLQK